MKEENAAFDYSDLIGRLIEDQYTQERRADLSDYAPVCPEEKAWVGTHIQPGAGRWVVSLLYIDPANPCRFVRVPVKYCRNQRIARIIAAYHQKIHQSRQKRRQNDLRLESDD